MFISMCLTLWGVLSHRVPGGVQCGLVSSWANTAEAAALGNEQWAAEEGKVGIHTGAGDFVSMSCRLIYSLSVPDRLSPRTLCGLICVLFLPSCEIKCIRLIEKSFTLLMEGCGSAKSATAAQRIESNSARHDIDHIHKSMSRELQGVTYRLF